MEKITAILPAYNEEVSIGSVVLRTRKYADRVIAIDDDSLDRTAEVAALAGAKVLRHDVNHGKGAALKTGIETQDVVESPTNFTKEAGNTENGLNDIITKCVWRRCI